MKTKKNNPQKQTPEMQKVEKQTPDKPENRKAFDVNRSWKDVLLHLLITTSDNILLQILV